MCEVKRVLDERVRDINDELESIETSSNLLKDRLKTYEERAKVLNMLKNEIQSSVIKFNDGRVFDTLQLGEEPSFLTAGSIDLSSLEKEEQDK